MVEGLQDGVGWVEQGTVVLRSRAAGLRGGQGHTFQLSGAEDGLGGGTVWLVLTVGVAVILLQESTTERHVPSQTLEAGVQTWCVSLWLCPW